LIITMREGESVSVDGPATILIKKTHQNKVVVLINAEVETKIKHESSKGAKD